MAGLRPLNNKQADLVRLVCEGTPLKEAAAICDLPQRTAVRVMARDDVKAMQMEYAENVLRMSAGKAARRITEQLDSDNPWVVGQAYRMLFSYLQTMDKGQQTAVVVNFGNMPTPGMPEKPIQTEGGVE